MLFRTVLLFLLAMIAGLALACGDDDDNGEEAAPRETTEVSAEDETALDAAIEAILTALRDHNAEALRVFAAERLQDRLQELDRQATDCVPEGGEITVMSREVRPGREGDANVQIVFAIVVGGEADEVRRDWRFTLEEDGSWKLRDRPDCPFPRQAAETTPAESGEGAESTEAAEETTGDS